MPPTVLLLIDMVEQPTAPLDDLNDAALVDLVRHGDAEAFESLVQRHHPSFTRAARLYAVDETAANDLVRNTWTTAITDLDRFDNRSSFKTWIYRILINHARDEGAAAVPFAATTRLADDPYPGAIDTNRLRPASDPTAPLHWDAFPAPWASGAMGAGPNEELRSVLEDALEALSPAQREVITLRDILGWPPAEVVEMLGITENSQRALLHRARAQVHSRLEEYLTP